TGAPVEPEAVPQTFDAETMAEGTIFETRPAMLPLLARLAARGKDAPIAALFADYGHVESGAGDTLQAVRRHRFADPLAAPGEADLTAQVDFAALTATAHELGLTAYGPMPQGQFLLKLGLETRCERLRQNAAPAQKAAILSGAAPLARPRHNG